jgi:hypothetical protein
MDELFVDGHAPELYLVYEENEPRQVEVEVTPKAVTR